MKFVSEGLKVNHNLCDIWQVTYTDTFAGELNYSSVSRKQFAVNKNVSRLAIVRQAKRIMGQNGERFKAHDSYGEFADYMRYDKVGVPMALEIEMIELTPFNSTIEYPQT